MLKKLRTASQSVGSTSLFGNEFISGRIGRSATRTPMALPPGRGRLFVGNARSLVADQVESVAVKKSVGAGGDEANGEEGSCHREEQKLNKRIVSIQGQSRSKHRGYHWVLSRLACARPLQPRG